MPLSVIINRKGVTRLVFLTKSYAIKIPRLDYGWRLFIEGIRANLNERDLFNIAQVPNTELYRIRHHLCPIIWVSWGAWIVVMLRCKPMVDNTNAREVFLALENICTDHKDDNYGLLNGKIVMLDYGSSRR